MFKGNVFDVWSKLRHFWCHNCDKSNGHKMTVWELQFFSVITRDWTNSCFAMFAEIRTSVLSSSISIMGAEINLFLLCQDLISPEKFILVWPLWAKNLALAWYLLPASLNQLFQKWAKQLAKQLVPFHQRKLRRCCKRQRRLGPSRQCGEMNWKFRVEQ